jgi:hypothetical protein
MVHLKEYEWAIWVKQIIKISGTALINEASLIFATHVSYYQHKEPC